MTIAGKYPQPAQPEKPKGTPDRRGTEVQTNNRLPTVRRQKQQLCIAFCLYTLRQFNFTEEPQLYQ